MEGPPDESSYAAVPMKFAIATTADAAWEPSDHGGLEARDLLLETATSGQMKAVDLRARYAAGFGAWPETRLATFIFFYVIEGAISFEMDDGAIIVLSRREAVHLPFLRHVVRVRYSGDLRAAEVRAPGSVDRQALVPLLQIGATDESADWESMIVRNRPELFIPGNGPRAFFTYRDLGTARITERRIHIHDGDGAKKPMAGGTGWHNHSMSQLFYVLDGEATVSVEGHGTHHMVAGDTMMIGKRMSHNVSSYSEGYNVFEICLPADYDTVAQSAPDAFAEAGN
jgi:mannose-6-phosphate isomerase-like protein (cupin superfamily)